MNSLLYRVERLVEEPAKLLLTGVVPRGNDFDHGHDSVVGKMANDDDVFPLGVYAAIEFHHHFNFRRSFGNCNPAGQLRLVPSSLLIIGVLQRQNIRNVAASDSLDLGVVPGGSSPSFSAIRICTTQPW